MKLGIMQPYFLPYIGYFQLIKAVDKYVVYDDVNYIKGGWINRNKILLNGTDFMINVPMKGASSFKKINEIEVDSSKVKILKTIQQAYNKAPYYDFVYPILLDIIEFESTNLAFFLKNSIKKICSYCQIDTEIILSSDIEKDNELKGQEKVISICKLLGATEYYNAIGGQDLYNKTVFLENGINLKFLEPNLIEYIQFKNNFIPWLSIIDVMMFNSSEEMSRILNNYELK